MVSSNLKITFLFIITVVLISFTVVVTINSNSHAEGLKKEDVNQLIKTYIQQNPQEILDSVGKYQVEQQRKSEEDAVKKVSEKLTEIHSNPLDPIAGNPQGDVILVQFFDYSCGYCKRLVPAITELLKEDNNVKIIFKELPILGENSVIESKASLAVNSIAPEKYFEFHTKLMASRITGLESILKIVSEIGLDAKLVEEKMNSAEISSLLASNKALADTIGVRGTPALIIGDKFIPGAIDLATMKQLIAKVRKGKTAPAPVQ
jgi:protein-disulfide isomerase